MEKANYRDNLEMLKGMFSTATVSMEKAANGLGISRYVLEQDETFPKQKIGGRWYVSVANLARWLSI